jgi:hypothetical protein
MMCWGIRGNENMANQPINPDSKKRRFALLFAAGYGQR